MVYGGKAGFTFVSMDHYTLVARALVFIEAHAKNQPSLEAVAQHVGLSPFHLQRIFSEWVGVSPKKFLQYISLERAKAILEQPHRSVYDAANKVGLSGTSRLHDLFVTIEGMTPGQFKNGGKNLQIFYSWQSSQFGNYLVAATSIGICSLFFYEGAADEAVRILLALWPQATLVLQEVAVHAAVKKFFQQGVASGEKIKLHLHGTDFQLKVWEALLRIPSGHLAAYGNIADTIGKPRADRAVGTAIGSNPVAFLIPCHRVIKSTGVIGNYRWGSERKRAIIGWEGAQSDEDKNFV